MLKNLSYICLLTLSVISIPATAQKKNNSLHRCSDHPEKTEIIITSHQNGIEINNRFSSMALNSKSKNSHAGDYVVGLTSSESITKIDFDGPVWQDDETGGECFAPRIKVSLHYSPIQVFIGNEFKHGSFCYGVILEHEKQHVRLYQENLPRIENILRSLMEKRFANRALYAPSGQSKQIVGNEIDAVWRPLIKTEFAKLQIEQNQLDNDEGFANSAWACLGIVQKFIGF